MSTISEFKNVYPVDENSQENGVYLILDSYFGNNIVEYVTYSDEENSDYWNYFHLMYSPTLHNIIEMEDWKDVEDYRGYYLLAARIPIEYKRLESQLLSEGFNSDLSQKINNEKEKIFTCIKKYLKR
jgi:hypothetical protein